MIFYRVFSEKYLCSVGTAVRKEHSTAVTAFAQICQKFNGLKLQLPIKSITWNNMIIEVGLGKGGIACYYREAFPNISVTVMLESI